MTNILLTERKVPMIGVFITGLLVIFAYDVGALWVATGLNGCAVARMSGISTVTCDVFFLHCNRQRKRGKGKLFPYSLPSIGPRADPGVQAVSPQVT